MLTHYNMWCHGLIRVTKQLELNDCQPPPVFPMISWANKESITLGNALTSWVLRSHPVWVGPDHFPVLGLSYQPNIRLEEPVNIHLQVKSALGNGQILSSLP